MNVECSGVEGGEGEELPHSSMIENEEKVESIFRIAEQQSGLPWRRRRGIPPILVVSLIYWVGSFPMQPLVVRVPEANSLCNLTGKAKLAWNEGATLFS